MLTSMMCVHCDHLVKFNGIVGEDILSLVPGGKTQTASPAFPLIKGDSTITIN